MPGVAGQCSWVCGLCGYEGLFTRYSVAEMMFGTGETFDYVQCPGCECLQITEVPTNLGSHYRGSYYSYRPRSRAHGLAGWLVRARNRYLLGRFDPLGRWFARQRPYAALASLGPLHLRGDESILDVGAGGGELLIALQGVGFRHLLGIDPFLSCDLELSDGLVIRGCGIGDVNGSWDVVMFHHSLEHMPDQVAALGAAARLLAPSGRCIVRVPTVSSWAWRHYGVHWAQLDAPRHLWLHSRRSLTLLVERAGLRLDRIGCDSTAFQFWASEQYRQGQALIDEHTHTLQPAPHFFDAATLAGYARRAAEFNSIGKGDQLVAWMTKV